MIKKLVRVYLICFMSLLLASSCEKEELPLKLPPKGDSKLMVVSMGGNYEQQGFVNLEDSSVYLYLQDEWDLQFDASPAGRLVFMNTGKGVQIARTGVTSFIQNFEAAAYTYGWDQPSGHPDSLMLSFWCNASGKTNDSVYIIDIGSHLSYEKRYFQFKILEVTDSCYIIRFANFAGTDTTTLVIPKDHSKAHVYFSFANGGKVLNFEPAKEKWDFCFLRYKTIFELENKQILPYTVTGIFINPGRVAVAVDSSESYDKLTPNFVKTLGYSNHRDVMGYDWKVYNGNTSLYETRRQVNYIFRENTNPLSYWKLHFIDFYQSGVKGSPKFEFLKLE